MPSFIAVVLAAATVVPVLARAPAPADGVADVADGTQIRTALAPSDIHLQNGAELRFSARSAGTLFSDHVLLEDGAVRLGHSNGYTVDAGELQIDASEPNAQAVVRMTPKTIEIASLGGEVYVTDGGARLTRIAAGTHLSFRQNASSNVARSGATSAPKKLPSDQHIMLWMIVAVASAAIIIGSIAAAQGKSPF